MQQQPETAEHKLRRLVVDVLQRLPQNETVKPYIHELLRLALQVIRTDNEENALICMHIFSDVFRAHKPQDPDSAMSFLEFVKGVSCCLTLHCVLSHCRQLLVPWPKGTPAAALQLWCFGHESTWHCGSNKRLLKRHACLLSAAIQRLCSDQQQIIQDCCRMPRHRYRHMRLLASPCNLCADVPAFLVGAGAQICVRASIV